MVAPEILRPEIPLGGVLVAAPVEGDTWQLAAELVNWLGARGAVLVPWTHPLVEVGDEIASHVFRFRVQTRYAALERLWIVELETINGRTDLKLSAPAGVGPVLDVAIEGERRVLVVYREELAARSDADQEISLQIDNLLTDDNDAIVRGIYCVDLDRADLAQDTDDWGVDVASCGPARPIYDPTDGEGRSLGAVLEALNALDMRRVGLHHWTVGDRALERLSSVAVDVTILPVPILASKDLRADTSGLAVWAVYGRMVSAGDGRVRLTTTASGVDDTHHVTWTADAWSAPRVIDVDCDDLDAEDGRQGAAWDDAQISIAGSDTSSAEIALKHASIYTDRALLYIGSV